MKLTTEQRQKYGSLLAQERDKRNKLHEIQKQKTALELEIIGEPFTKELEAIPESVFTPLKYDERNSDKLKIFEVADRQNNNPKTFDEALKALQERGATIAERFHPEGYSFEYWCWKNRIFRKSLQK